MARRKSSVHRPTYSGKRLEDVLQMKKSSRKAPMAARKAPVARKRYGRKALYQPDLSLDDDEEEDEDEEDEDEADGLEDLDSEDEAFETIIAAINDEGSNDEASNDDDEGDSDDDDEDSDSSIDETSLPEAYRRRKFGAKSAKKSMLQNENESAIADSSEESDLSSLSDLEAKLDSKESTLVRRMSRRGSVVDHTLDEHVEFPRHKLQDLDDSSDDSFEEESLLKAIEADSSPNPEGSDFDEDFGDLDEEEMQNGDIGSPLSDGSISYSSIDAFSDAVDKDFDSINDNDIEREEEENILQEIAENGNRLHTMSPTDDDESVASFGNNYSRRNSHSQHHYTGYSSDEDEYSFDDNDPFFEPRDPNQVLITNGDVGAENNNTLNHNTRTNSNTTITKGGSSDDDSYLFGYFFSDGSSSEDEAGSPESLNKRSPSLTTPKKPPAAGSSSSIFKNQQNGYSDYLDSGDSTDEDTTLPPRTQKKCNTATEILSSSTIASRPPMLGSWVMTKERPFGIIDGLTTRSLSGQKSPPITNSGRKATNGIRYSAAIESDCSDISDLNDIILDEFIYTSDLDEEAPKDASAESQPYSTSSNVPLSAFRNRGLIANPLYQQRFTGTPIPSRRRPSHSREAVITPVRGLRKIKKKAFRKDLLMHKDYDGTDYGSNMVAEYSDGFNGFYGNL